MLLMSGVIVIDTHVCVMNDINMTTTLLKCV